MALCFRSLSGLRRKHSNQSRNRKRPLPLKRNLAMSEIISPRRWIETVENRLHFNLMNGNCFSFPCDEKGKVDEASWPPAARDNFRSCVSGRFKVKRSERLEWVSVEKIPAVLKCDCGKRVNLHSGWANECECGREYNGSGQLLAPREQWGEETGETF